MNEGILNKTLVDKNIDLINSYSEVENEKLNIIFSNFNSCTKCYKTSNTGKISSKLSNLGNNIHTINNNRKKYCEVLTEAIKIYDDMAEEVVNSANSLGESIND